MDKQQKAIFNRTERLLGAQAMKDLGDVKVIIFGVGGVGSWCAEGLIRSGIRHLTMVDPDRVCITNINRQLMATSSTVGKFKVEVLRDRLLDINPGADIQAIRSIYSADNWEDFRLGEYDYVIDAVDSLKDKAHLILKACESGAVFFSSMGAALKTDPTRIRVAEFWQVRGCPLAAAIRKKFKRAGILPAHKFLCVYDDEVLPNLGSEVHGCNEDCPYCPKGREIAFDSEDRNKAKAVVNGTTAHITGIFGFTLCGLVIRDLCRRMKG